MNRRILLKLLLMAIILLVNGCQQEKEPISVTAISLSQTTLEMVEGESHTLSVSIQPANADNQSVSWISSQTAIASVQNGVVTAHKVGTAAIIATTVDGGKTATCTVTVESNYKPVSDVSLNYTSIEMTEGDQFTLTATFTPENATNKNIIWTTSNAEVATVSDGKVTAVKAGTATITVTTEDGNKTATCEVNVTEKIYSVEGISLDKTTIELTEGDEAILTATITPDNATNKNMTWTSSDESVVTVSEGKVTALKKGIATITVTTEDGKKTATCEVSVKEKPVPVENVYLDKAYIELIEGRTATLTATVSPDNATNKKLTWISSDTDIVSVDNGRVTAHKVGTATITVKTDDGGKTATCEVKVKSIVVDGGIEGTEDWWYVK